MTKFSQLAHSPDGRTYLKSIDVSAFEIRLGAKVAIGATLIALAYYAHDFPPGMMVLGVTGVVVLVATCISTWMLLARDGQAYNWRNEVISAHTYEVDAPDVTRTIPLISNGVTTQLTIDARDEALTKLILTILDVSIKHSSAEATTFLPYRQLGVRYVDYNSALMGLGSLVRRERGVPPSVVYPHTLGTVRAMFAMGNTLPFRQGASESANRVK